MLVDFTGSLSSLTQEPTHSLSTLHLNKVIVAVIVVDFLIVFVIFRLQVSLADGGNYSCQPASLPRASTTLHVLKVNIIIFILIDIVVQTEKKQKIVEKPLTTSGVPDQTWTKTSAFLLIASLLSLST